MQRLKRSRKKLPFQGTFSVIIHYTYRIVHFLSPKIILEIADPAYYLVSNAKCFAICKELFTNFSNLIFELATLTLFLIIISNTSLLNPGPKIHGLTCFFQNVQGLITFSSFGKSFPEINKTEITEFQSHIFETSPDIVILNEAWLKPAISDEEILPSKMYKIFRVDRSVSSHPPDPTNHRKFKLNGGGVLIAVKNTLNLNPKLIKLTCSAEVLTLPNKKKICVSTLYRVGTLRRDNFLRLQQYYSSIFTSKRYKHTL